MSMYITLPCTASKTEFPANSRGKFTTLLAQEVYLPGSWDVGLCEIFLPVPKVESKFDIVYVYCDLVEYSYVGDTMVPCLRTVSLPNKNKITVQRYDNVHYMPLQSNRFTTIEISIAGDLGEIIEFKEGLTIVKLHFWPRK